MKKKPRQSVSFVRRALSPAAGDDAQPTSSPAGGADADALTPVLSSSNSQRLRHPTSLTPAALSGHGRDIRCPAGRWSVSGGRMTLVGRGILSPWNVTACSSQSERSTPPLRRWLSPQKAWWPQCLAPWRDLAAGVLGSPAQHRSWGTAGRCGPCTRGAAALQVTAGMAWP
jgi:hypothetical protein